jgi:hypothetical protein
VFKNLGGVKKSDVVDPVDFWKIKKKLVKFAKICSNRRCERNSNLLKN